MPFPLIPLLIGAAAGAVTTYLMMDESGRRQLREKAGSVPARFRTTPAAAEEPSETAPVEKVVVAEEPAVERSTATDAAAERPD